MDKRIALLFGSTGLVGNLLLEELMNSDIYSTIKIFVRRSTGISHPKVAEIVMDFSKPEKYSTQITGDDLFICLGSTIKKAGSVSKFEKIDRDLPVNLAGIAKKNGISGIAVISSVGASSSSRNYYLRVKGEMELGISVLKFDHMVFARPSLLLGERKEKRPAEIMSKFFMKAINPVLGGKLKKYRAIHARDVAKAMIAALHKDPSKTIYESDELKILVDQK
jgi:uncharacterized protein YbjT (DUF2867 family)